MWGVEKATTVSIKCGALLIITLQRKMLLCTDLAYHAGF